MPEATHQLAAIMFTDIVGYTTLMGKDEQQAIRLLDKNLSIQKPLIEQHQGKLMKEIGDGLLCSFNSVIEAVKCAMEIQHKLKDDLELNIRVGIHTGDVLFRDGDVLGDGVNIASRLESLASSGEILVSEAVYKNIKNQEGIQTEFVKEETLKNVAEPVKIYKVSDEIPDTDISSSSLNSTSIRPFSKRMAIRLAIGVLVILALSYILYSQIRRSHSEEEIDKSIAVLPFIDLSPKKDQEYFSDGISEELINALAKNPELKVVGRTSSFSFKDKGMTLKEIGEELKVGNILAGSVRKSGDQLRITAQLINTESGFHLWTETINTELTDIFKVQDQITSSIMEALDVILLNKKEQFEVATTIPEAYNTYFQARQKLALRGKAIGDAIDLFKKTINLDSNFSPAYSGMAKAYSLYSNYNLKEYSNQKVYELSKEAAHKAIALNPENAEAYLALGNIAMQYEWEWKKAEEYLLRAIEISPNDAEIYNFLGDYYVTVFDKKKGIQMESKAVELDPLLPINHVNLAIAYVIFGEYENALGAVNSMFELGLYSEFNRSDLNYPKPMIQSLIKLGRFEEVMNLSDTISNNYLNAWIAVIKKDSAKAKNIADQLRVGNEIEIYLALGMIKEAADGIERAYEERAPGFMNNLTIPEDFPSHPVLQKALDKPELNALFEIRRKNLKLIE